MAISFVGSLAPVGANNGGNVTLDLSTLGLAQNDVVVCAYASSGTADAAMSTSSTGWTEVHENYANGSSQDTNLALYYKVMGASPDTSFVAVGPGGSANGTIATAMAFRGVDAAVLDIAFVAANHAATGTATTRPNAPSITPANSGAWPVVVGAGSTGAGAAFTNPGDLSSTANHFRSANHAETNDIAIGIGIKTDWTSGAFDPAQWTGGASNAGDSWAAMVIALKASTATTHQGAAALSGAGTLAASGQRTIRGASALSGSGTGSFIARLTAAARAALTGAGTMLANAAANLRGLAQLGGAGSLSASGEIAGGDESRCERSVRVNRWAMSRRMERRR